MVKCPKCSSRKGKRHCPGLGATICSACCGEYRHTEIDCPEDCAYLAQEPVHQQRRMEKSRSGGRHFLKFIKESIFNEREWRFSFSLFVEVYAYNQRCGALTDAEILGVLKDLRRLFGTIIVPGPRPHPLSTSIEERCSQEPDLDTVDGFSAADRLDVIQRLEAAITRKAGRDTRHMSEILEGFFAPLDLEADLGYSVAADPREIDLGYRERPSGLIVPPM